MKGAVAITHAEWARHLRSLPQLDECNFWQPGGPKAVRLPELTPWFFKTNKAGGNQIIGFALLLKWLELSVRDAWMWFGSANGAPDEGQFRALLSSKRRVPIAPNDLIGCVLLLSPLFFPEEHWFPGPSDWAPNIVNYKYYDLRVGEGRRIWNCCRERAQLDFAPSATKHNLDVLSEGGPASRFGAAQSLRPRLGQGTFRAALIDAYSGSCAVSRDHTTPALEAAHIQPYGDGGSHDTANGLLLRADIHRLYDRNLVTVTPEYRFEVSSRLAKDFSNGRAYYKMQGTRIVLPQNVRHWPDPQLLEWHASRLAS